MGDALVLCLTRQSGGFETHGNNLAQCLSECFYSVMGLLMVEQLAKLITQKQLYGFELSFCDGAFIRHRAID